jgi:hypothetical protein
VNLEINKDEADIILGWADFASETGDELTDEDEALVKRLRFLVDEA